MVAKLRAHRAEQAKRRLAFGEDWTDLDLVCEAGDGSPQDPSSLTHGFGRIAEAAEVKGARYHDLRHAWCQALLAEGVRPELVSKMAGHSSVAFTLSTYGMPDDRSLDEGREGIEAALG